MFVTCMYEKRSRLLVFLNSSLAFRYTSSPHLKNIRANAHFLIYGIRWIPVTKVWFITTKFCSVENFNRSLVAKSTLQQVYWYAILATCSVQ